MLNIFEKHHKKTTFLSKYSVVSEYQVHIRQNMIKQTSKGNISLVQLKLELLFLT